MLPLGGTLSLLSFDILLFFMSFVDVAKCKWSTFFKFKAYLQSTYACEYE